jgi:hypothetical protein
LQAEASELRAALGRLAGQLTQRNGAEERVREQLHTTQQQVITRLAGVDRVCAHRKSQLEDPTY